MGDNSKGQLAMVNVPNQIYDDDIQIDFNDNKV